jgi:cholesterol transport system auxiliary component
MAYLLRPHEVRYYASNQWADTPSRMLARLLTQVLDRSGPWRTVVQLPSSVRGNYRLDTEDLAIQQEFFSQPSRLRLTLHIQLVELPTQTVIAARRFEIVEDALSDDAYGGVLAANRAVTKLLDQTAAWLGRCLKDMKPSACPK